MLENPDWLIPQRVTVNYAPGAAALLAQFFGRVVSAAEVAQMVGALDDAEVYVGLHKRFSPALFFEVFHPALITRQREIGFEEIILAHIRQMSKT